MLPERRLRLVLLELFSSRLPGFCSSCPVFLRPSMSRRLDFHQDSLLHSRRCRSAEGLAQSDVRTTATFQDQRSTQQGEHQEDNDLFHKSSFQISYTTTIRSSYALLCQVVIQLQS